MRGRFAALLFAILATGGLSAEPREIAAIDLRHRPPEELIPLIRPLLSRSDAAIPNRNQLILKASPATIREIRQLLEQIDKAPHRLLITVSQDRQAVRDTASAGFGGRIEFGRSYSGATQESQIFVKVEDLDAGKP